MSGPGPTANQRCLQDKAGMKSEEQVGHRPDSKHKARAVCGANAARKVHAGVSSRHRCGPNAQRPSAHARGRLLPSTGQGRNSTFCRQRRLEVKIPCTQPPEGQRQGHRCQGLRCSRVHLCFRRPSPSQGVPCLRHKSLRAQDQESAEARGDARPGSPQVPAKGKLTAGGAPHLRVFVH